MAQCRLILQEQCRVYAEDDCVFAVVALNHVVFPFESIFPSFLMLPALDPHIVTHLYGDWSMTAASSQLCAPLGKSLLESGPTTNTYPPPKSNFIPSVQLCRVVECLNG